MDEYKIASIMADLKLPPHRYFKAIGSTNDQALEWAAAGAPDGSLVIADEQTAGRGRMQRRWVTSAGVSLAFSQIFRPTPLEKEYVSLFAPLAALAVADALRDGFGLDAMIKWPNDVLLDGRKMTGILVEISWLGDQVQAIVLGVGMNVALGSIPPREELMFPATCIEEILGKPVDRYSLFEDVIRRLVYWRGQLASPGFYQGWQSRLAFMGERVRVAQAGDEEKVGILTGVDEAGNLCLQGEDGREMLVSYGDVHLRLLE